MWAPETDGLLARMADRFARVETRHRTRGFVLGLPPDLPRKNCRTITEHAGDRDPRGMQHLAYSGARSHAMIDRELYLPKSWTDDPDRLIEAAVPDDIDFLTKPALATGMLVRALNAGVAARPGGRGRGLRCRPTLRAEP